MYYCAAAGLTKGLHPPHMADFTAKESAEPRKRPPLRKQIISEPARPRSEGGTASGACMRAHEVSQPLESEKAAITSSGHASEARGGEASGEAPELGTTLHIMKSGTKAVRSSVRLSSRRDERTAPGRLRPSVSPAL